MKYDKELWITEKKKCYLLLKKRKLPAAFVKQILARKLISEEMLEKLKSNLLFIEEMFVYEPEILMKYYPYEDIMKLIPNFESLYQISLEPIEDKKQKTRFSLYCFRVREPYSNLDFRILLESSMGIELWQALVDNAPPLNSTDKTNVDWFMQQSKGIKFCLDMFYKSRSYAKAYYYLITMYSFMGNISHFIQRLHIPNPRKSD